MNRAKLALAAGWLLSATLMAPAANCAAAADAADARQPSGELAARLKELDGRVIVLGTVRQSPLAPMLGRYQQAQLRAARERDRAAWEEVDSKAAWETFRDQRLAALRGSLGAFPPPPRDLRLQVVRAFAGEGHVVQNLVYETRPGLVVTANLYRPAQLAGPAPAILLCHSHLSAKHTGARPDMAQTWARAGCIVLVPDHLGHGERRQHPFGEEGGHDYHFRYDAGMQLHLAGESLMGWLAWDLMRGVDLLLAQPNVDPKRVILVSEPAGGGDVAAVTAALDPRIACAMVQNFGGPEPESPYPLPADAGETFDFAGEGSWESTRNLRLSARDGFLPWLIVASPAPRRLVYYHEFYWDREQDPVWRRLEKVYGFYRAGDALAGLAGRGFVVGSAPENTHWLPENRALLYPLFERWFGIPSPQREASDRRPPAELHCLTADALRQRQPQPLAALVRQVASERLAAARQKRGPLSAAEARAALVREWTGLLGNIEPRRPVAKGSPRPIEKLPAARLERLHLGTEPGIVVPALLLLPETPGPRQPPVVLAVAQAGKQAFLESRGELIAELLAAGVAVRLPDLRGVGETRPDDSRDRRSAAPGLSASAWMCGESLLGERLRDLRGVILQLRERSDVDARRLALWGDSFTPPLGADQPFALPHTAADRPPPCEPLGGLLAVLGGLVERDVRAVYVRGGLASYQSALATPFCYVPHDAIVPGALAVGDVPDLAAALSPTPLRLEGLVDGHNRRISAAEFDRAYQPTRPAERARPGEARWQFRAEPAPAAEVARWLVDALQP